ncbi:hypothetical protein EV386_0656 [Xylanimonas ulmi]|uniref:Uncharacterized protein n=1 Tax=Xylanimonas ulmi TaxID=228973 RepID=A0A4Q7M390_9MICO|nr:hypothetical protein EV386_0656 [Xylanibacterium ulmi]
MSCAQCHRPLHDCPSCNGGRASGLLGKVTCARCRNVGLVCDEHGGHWRVVGHAADTLRAPGLTPRRP